MCADLCLTELQSHAMEILAYLMSGVLAGLMAGLLGIGGGLVVVPTLALLFARNGFSADSVMHYAVGTSLATIIPTSLSSLLAHQRRASVYWAVVRPMAPGILLGALASAWLARQLSSTVMARVFGVFLLLVAVQLLLGARPSPRRQLPGAIGLGVVGSVIGLVSALLGIGGGTLTTSFLLWSRVDIRIAVGTAAAIGLPIAVAGALGFVINGLDAVSQPGYNSGFIYWPAVAAIVLVSVPMAPLGARLAHHLPRVALQRVFALVLLVIGARMAGLV